MMTSGVLPPSGFALRNLDLVELAADGRCFRLSRRAFPDPLGFGYAPSRFSDPEVMLEPPDRYGVIYFGSSLKVCFAETILRDRGDGRLGPLPIEWTELLDWTAVEFRIERPLSLVDLTGDGMLRMGVPTDVARASTHDLSRVWSRAFWTHARKPDGIRYESRLTGDNNIALYDRSLSALAPVDVKIARRASDLAGGDHQGF